MATELSLLYLLDVGSADLPVDFRHHYRASWLGKLVRCFSKNTLKKNSTSWSKIMKDTAKSFKTPTLHSLVMAKY